MKEIKKYYKNKNIKIDHFKRYYVPERPPEIENLSSGVTEKEDMKQIFERVLTRLFEDEINYGRVQMSIALFNTVKNLYKDQGIDVEEELLESIQNNKILAQHFEVAPNHPKSFMCGYLYGVLITTSIFFLFTK